MLILINQGTLIITVTVLIMIIIVIHTNSNSTSTSSTSNSPRRPQGTPQAGWGGFPLSAQGLSRHAQVSSVVSVPLTNNSQNGVTEATLAWQARHAMHTLHNIAVAVRRKCPS